MKHLNFLVLLVLISCGSGEVKKELDTSYRTSGIEQFFLTELPGWANFSASGSCFKNQSFHYLDFAKVASTYQLKYDEVAELQAQFNERIENYFRSTAVKFLKPVEEASFFANSLEQVRGGVKSMKLPTVAEVDIIWVDGFVSGNKVNELKAQASTGKFDEKLPVLFSACLSKQALTQWVTENGLDQVGFYLLPAEWLTPYGSEMTLKAGLKIEVQKILTGVKKINLVAPSATIPPTELVLE